LPPHKLALRLCDESQITVKCALLPVSRGFTARRTGSGLRFLVQQLDECVVALFKFGRFDRCTGNRKKAKVVFGCPFSIYRLKADQSSSVSCIGDAVFPMLPPPQP